MNSTLARMTCRIVIASMLLLPFQSQAGLIGTDRAAGAPAPANLISRGVLAAQLQMLGVSPEEARARVAALSDAEIANLAGRAGEQPAGGVSGLLWIAVIVFLIWRFTASDQAKAEAAAREKASKPAPEKK